jgi:hypothetical protein
MCPECLNVGIPLPPQDIGKDIKAYQCSNGHVFRFSLRKKKTLIVFIPFKELTSCPKCQSRELKKICDQEYVDADTYPGEQKTFRLVIYRCPSGHRTTRRQIVVRDFK